MRCTVPIQYLLIMGTWSASQHHPENVSNKTLILWDLNDEYGLFCLIISSAKCEIESVTLNRRPERPGRGVRGNSLVALGGYSWRQRSNNYPMSAHPPLSKTQLPSPPVLCSALQSNHQFLSNLVMKKWNFGNNIYISLKVPQVVLSMVKNRFIFVISKLYSCTKIFQDITFLFLLKKQFPPEYFKISANNSLK